MVSATDSPISSCVVINTLLYCVSAFDHSGKRGEVDFLNGVMGFANAQRTLDYIRIITEFIAQPEYRDVVPMFGVINEPLVATIGNATMSSLCVLSFSYEWILTMSSAIWKPTISYGTSQA